MPRWPVPPVLEGSDDAAVGLQPGDVCANSPLLYFWPWSTRWAGPGLSRLWLGTVASWTGAWPPSRVVSRCRSRSASSSPSAPSLPFSLLTAGF